MSNTVDNKVVSMEFDNKQFEAGIKETITSLDNLKQALQFNTQVTGLNTLQQHFNSFSLGNIESAVESLSNRFSTLGIVGMNVISNLTNKAIGFASKLEQVTFGQITSGGKARAQKVADARFQLEGLFAKYEDGAERVKSAFDSASKAVDGTAYGLDAAVSTTSQLATSGVELGSDMDTALRAIAGSAAMANSSFEEMGYVFNQVAAKGRLQGDEIMQFSSRGLNVLGILADSMHTTTEEVRDMTSKGQISFQQFSEAMNEAFGDQAQRANETLTGALSNVRAALSRIGEIFYSGIIENKEFIEMVNQLRLAINRVKKEIEPLKEPFKTLVSSVSKLGASILKFFGYSPEAKTFIETIADGMNTLSGWIDAFTAHVDAMRKALGLDEIVQTAKTADKVLRSLTEREENAARAIWERGTFGNGAIREQMLAAAGINYDNVQDLVNLIVSNNGDITAAVEQYKNTVKSAATETKEAVTDTKEEVEETSTAYAPSLVALQKIVEIFNMVKQGITSVKKVVGALGRSIKNVFSWKDVYKDFSNFIKIVAELGSAIEINDERAEKLEGIFSGLLSVIDLIRQAFGFVASVLSATLSPILSVIIDAFLWLGDKVGRAVTNFNNFVKESRLLNIILVKLRSAVSKITDWLGLFFEKFTQLPAVQKITDALGDFSDTLKGDLLTYIDKAMMALDDLFGVADNADTSTMDRILGNINTALEDMLQFSSDTKSMLDKVYDKFKLIADPIANVTDAYSQLRINMAKTKLISGDLLKSKGPIGILSTLAGYFDVVRDKLNGFAKFIVEKVTNFDYAKTVLIGFAASVMTLLGSLSYFFFTFSNVAISMETMFYSISGTFKALAKRIYDPLNGKAKIIKAVALALLSLAASLYLISKIPSDRLWDCVGAMTAILTVIASFAITFTILTKKLTAVESANLIKLLTQLAAVMLSLAGAVFILSASLALLSVLDPTPMFIGLGVLTLLLAEITGVAIVISKYAPSISKGGISLLFLAGSVYILVASLNKLSELQLDGIIEKLGIVGLCLITIGGIALLASKTSFSSMVGILAIVGSIWLIELALIDIMAYGVSMDEILLHLNQFIPVLIILGMIGGLMIAMGVTGAKATGVAGVIIASAVSIMAIMLAIRLLAKTYNDYGSEAYALACMGIIAIFGMIILMVRVMQIAAVKASGAAKALISIGAMLAIMALVLVLLGKVSDIEVIIQGIGALAAISVLAVMLVAVSQFSEKANPKSIAAMIGMIASMALIIALLSLIPNKDAMWEAVSLFGLALLSLATSMWLVCNQAKKINEKKLLLMTLMVATVALSLLALAKYGKDYGNVIGAAGALGVAMLSVGGTMAIINKSWPSNLSKRRLGEMAIMIGMVTVVGASIMGIAALGKDWKSVLTASYGMTMVLVAMAYAMQIINRSWPKKMTKTKLAGLAISIGMIAVIGASLMGIAAVGGKDDYINILMAGTAMSMVLAVFIGMLDVLKKSWPSGLTGKDLASMAIMIGLVAVIGSSLMGIAALGDNWTSILFAAIAMSTVMMAFAGMMAIISTVHINLADATSLALASVALVPIAATLAILAQFSWGELIRACVQMGVALALLTGVIVALAALNYAIPGGVTLILESLVPPLYAMAAVLLTLSLSIMAFTKCVPILVRCLIDLTKVQYSNIKLDIIFALVGAVAALGVAMFVFASGLIKVAMALAITGVGLMSMSMGLSALLLPAILLSGTIDKLVVNIAALGASGKTYAAGLEALAKSMKKNFSTILVSVVKGITDGLVELAESQPKIISSLTIIGNTVLALLYSWVEQVAEIVGHGVLRLSAVIANYAPKIVRNILHIVDTLLEGLVSYANTLAKYAIILVYSFVTGAMIGLELMFPTFLERVVSLILTIIESIAQVLYNNQDRISNAVRAVIDIVALTLFNILNEIFGGMLEKIDWYQGIEEELSANVQRIAAQQGKSAASTASSFYQSQLNNESGAISDTTSSVVGGALDDTSEVAERKANLLGGLTTDGIVNKVKSGASDLKNGFQSLFDNGIDGVDTSSVEHIAGETADKATSYDTGRTRHVVEQNISGLTDIAIDRLKKDGWKFSDTAEDIMYKEYWTSAAETEADKKTSDTFNSNVDKLTNNSELSSILVNNGEYGTGQYYSGMLNIDTNKYVSELSKQSTNVVEDGLVTPTEDALGIDSPSKVAAEISEYYLKGLVVGVKDNMSLVNGTFCDLGNAISEETKKSLYTFSDLLGDDKEWQPTIKPIVDTSNIETAKQLVDDTFDSTSFKMAANASASVGDSTQSALAAQVAMLTEQVGKLANADYSKMLEGVQINVDASTTVDGVALRQSSAKYTLQTMDDKQRGYIMSRGGRA